MVRKKCNLKSPWTQMLKAYCHYTKCNSSNNQVKWFKQYWLLTYLFSYHNYAFELQNGVITDKWNEIHPNLQCHFIFNQKLPDIPPSPSRLIWPIYQKKIHNGKKVNKKSIDFWNLQSVFNQTHKWKLWQSLVLNLKKKYDAP